MRVPAFAAAAMAVTGLFAAAARAAPPPASAFGRIPAVVQAAISPNGQHVALLGGASDQRFVSIATIDQPGLPVLPLGEVEGVSLRWAGDDYVLARLAVFDKLAPRASYRFERNIAVDLQAKMVSRLLGGSGPSNFLVGQPIMGVAAGPPARVLTLGLIESTGASSDMNTHIQRKGVDNPFVTALYAVDPATGRGSVVERGTYDTEYWEVDLEGQPRVRLDVDEITHRFTIMGRAKGRSQYARLWGGDFDARRAFHGYSAADDAIFLDINGQIQRMRLSDGATEPFGHPSAGTNQSLLFDELRGTVIGVTSGAEKPATEWLDPEIGAVATALSHVFKDRNVELANWSADRSRYVLRVSAPSAPPVWYLFDKTRKELSPLGEEYPELKGVALGTTRWITYKARDGLEIPAYLTLPPGASATGKLPLIVLPHGGPTARDDYDFDFIAQFLATRGYAVLQPQFRGSWGFGKAFEDAGRGEWGDKMQTDLLDGVAAVAQSGAVDPHRVCIVGASFGGYAALAGAALHSQDYRCAAAIAGISDLGLLLVEQARLYGRDSASMGELRQMLGEAPSAKLAATSPAKQAGGVAVPILLIHGDKDTVVPIEQSELMANTLRGLNKPVEFVVLQDENHYLTRAATRTQALEALQAFLAKNLPVTP